MPKAELPYFLLEGYYRRYSRINTPIGPKSRFEKSLFKNLSEAHDGISLPCCSQDCSDYSCRTIIVKADYQDDIEEFEDFTEFYPEVSDAVYAVIPVCLGCSNPSFNKDFRINDTECILFDSNGNAMLYRYSLHCEERMIIAEKDPSSSYCLVCGETIDMMNYKDDIHDDDDDSVSNPNLTLWEH